MNCLLIISVFPLHTPGCSSACNPWPQVCEIPFATANFSESTAALWGNSCSSNYQLKGHVSACAHFCHKYRKSAKLFPQAPWSHLLPVLIQFNNKSYLCWPISHIPDTFITSANTRHFCLELALQKIWGKVRRGFMGDLCRAIHGSRQTMLNK